MLAGYGGVLRSLFLFLRELEPGAWVLIGVAILAIMACFYVLEHPRKPRSRPPREPKNK